MLKFLVFCIIFLIVIPAGAFAASKNDKIRTGCFCLMLFFTCWMQMIHIAPLPDWRGGSRGYALTLVDILNAIIFLSMVFDTKVKKYFFPPGWWAYFLYFGLSLLSVINAVYVLQWGFEAVKMFWMYVFFISCYTFLLHHKNLWVALYTICGTVFFLFLVGFSQKYVTHSYYQIPSTMPHQNSLSLYLALYGTIILSVLLNEKSKFYQQVILAVGFISALLLDIFTYSRGGLICFLGGVGIVSIFSILLDRLSGRKIFFLVSGVFAALILLGIAAPRIAERFLEAPEASKTTRVYLAMAATRMANDYFLGVGLNNFCGQASPLGKYTVELYEGKKYDEDETIPYGGIVETIYLLVAAECGWITLGALLCWFFFYWILSGWCLLLLRGHPCFGISLGVFSGLSSNYLQSTIEWSLKQYGNFYQLMFVFALISAVWTTRNALRRKENS